MLQRNFLSLEVVSGRYELQPAAWSDAWLQRGLWLVHAVHGNAVQRI